MVLKWQFYTYQHDPECLIQEFVTGLTTLADQLKGLGIMLMDNDIVDIIIYVLHANWLNITGTLTANQGAVKLVDVIGALVDEEACRAPQGESALHVSTGKVKGGWQERRTCFTCGKHGHIASVCPEKKKGAAKEEVAAVAVQGHFYVF